MLITANSVKTFPKDFEVLICKRKIEKVNQMKYLGVIMDDKFTWKPHIQHLCSKLSSGSWALLQLRNSVDFTSLKTVHYSLIYSHLQYCISLLGV